MVAAIVVSLIAAAAALTGTFVTWRNHREMVKRSDEDRLERRRDAELRTAQSELDRQCLAIENAVKRAADSDPHTQLVGFNELIALMDSGQVPDSRVVLVEAVTKVALKALLESAEGSTTPVEMTLIRPKVVAALPNSPMSSDTTAGGRPIGSSTPVEPPEQTSDNIGEPVL